MIGAWQRCAFPFAFLVCVRSEAGAGEWGQCGSCVASMVSLRSLSLSPDARATWHAVWSPRIQIYFFIFLFFKRKGERAIIAALNADRKLEEQIFLSYVRNL